MSKNQNYGRRITVLINRGKKFSGRAILEFEYTAECQYWFSSVVTLVQGMTALDKFFYGEAVDIVRRSKRQGGIWCGQIQEMIGFLRQLRDAIRKGYLVRVEEEVRVDDLKGFLEHAEQYAHQGRKAEASVIATAVFEDTMKRLAARNQLDKSENAESRINGLKSAGVLSAPEAKKLKYYAGLRNAALHASWEEFELDDVINLIKGIRKLTVDHLAPHTQLVSG